MSSVSGRCLCGQITVSVDKQALDADNSVALCHCTNCRKVGGSVASINLLAPESAVKITGQPKIYQDSNTGSGATSHRTFCGNCGSPIYSATPNMPGIKILKLGLFEDIPKPALEVYCRSKPSWVKVFDDTKQFDTMPPK